MAEQRVQRRLAAILAADVVGYSRMMEADETGTLARLKALRADFLHPKVSEYGGRIVKTTGDGTLVEFPSVVDAVQHAIDVQSELNRRDAERPDAQKITLRFGINIGDIIIDGDDIYGDGVNIAARLEAMAEPGGISLSAMAYEGVRKKLDIPFEDLGEQSFKNIAEPVRVFRIVLNPLATAGQGRTSTDAIFRRPAVAVLPFDNLSGDPEQDYFADGLTEDLITGLSLERSFPVIARNSVFTYRGKARDLRKIGEELGARYVIEGSVRTAGRRVRVTAQLINADTGHHVWAERYDRDLEDIFQLQDEISGQISGTVFPELHRAEQGRLQVRNPASLDAWGLFQRGLALCNRFSAADVRAARDMFEQALARDPGYARACAYIAFTHHVELWLEFSSARDQSLSRLIEFSRRAVMLDSSDAFAHLTCSLAATWLREHDMAVFEAQESVRLNPSASETNVSVGTALEFAGRPEEAIGWFERALRLSPQDPNRRNYYIMLCRSQATAGRLESAVESASRAIQIRPDNAESHLILVSSLARLGRQTDAEEALRKAREILSDGIALPASWSRYTNEAPRRELIEGLRKAGWSG